MNLGSSTCLLCRSPQGHWQNHCVSTPLGSSWLWRAHHWVLCELRESFDPSRPGQGLIFRSQSPLSLYPNSASSSWPLRIQCSGAEEPKKVKPKGGEQEQLAHITHSRPSVSGPSGILMMDPGLLPKEGQHWAYQLWGSQESPTPRSQEEGLQGEHSV